MKKINLRLRRESLRPLSPQETSEVDGGVPVSGGTTKITTVIATRASRISALNLCSCL